MSSPHALCPVRASSVVALLLLPLLPRRRRRRLIHSLTLAILPFAAAVVRVCSRVGLYYVSMSAAATKPRVLVLGGVGFIGRNLVTYLVQNDIASLIRVVDKVLPATAFLGSPHREAFENPIVDCKQCNLSADGMARCSAAAAAAAVAPCSAALLLTYLPTYLSACLPVCGVSFGRCVAAVGGVRSLVVACVASAGVAKAYALEEGTWDWVINLAAETKYGQTEEVYKEKVLDLSVKVATKAAELGVPKFIEFSHAQVYAHGKVHIALSLSLALVRSIITRSHAPQCRNDNGKTRSLASPCLAFACGASSLYSLESEQGDRSDQAVDQPRQVQVPGRGGAPWHCWPEPDHRSPGHRLRPW